LLNLAIVLLSAPVIEWIGKAPEIAATIRNKLHILERPIAALHDLQNVISRGKGGDSGLEINITNFIQAGLSLLTPAIGELVLFFGTLFFGPVSDATQGPLMTPKPTIATSVKLAETLAYVKPLRRRQCLRLHQASRRHGR
jgi:hypothetical protein